MRKIVAGLFVSLDGVTEAPETWQSPYMDQELGQALGETMAGADTLLLGRRTYEEWAGHWPHMGGEVPFADIMNDTLKLVASTTLRSVDWQNSTLIDGDVAEHLTELKRRPGKDILINGSTTLVRSLLDRGLIDRLELLLHPLVVGRGERLFDGTAPGAFGLTNSHKLGNGVVALTYTSA